MRWQPANIARWCLDAGWPRVEVPVAVAYALAVSGGDDAWRWPDPPASYGCRRGLWGADCVGWLPEEAERLYDPVAAARDALARWRADNCGWGWTGVAADVRLAELVKVGRAALDAATPVMLVRSDDDLPRLAGAARAFRDLVADAATRTPPPVVA